LKKVTKKRFLFGAAQADAEYDAGKNGAEAKVFWFFFSKKNTSSCFRY
jgi:hypothetical protein